MKTTTSTATSTHTPWRRVGLKASKVVSSESPSGEGSRGSSATAREELVVDAAQRGQVRVVAQPGAEVRVLPRVPGRADQLAGDPLRLGGEQELGELCGPPRGRATLGHLLLRLLVVV